MVLSRSTQAVVGLCDALMTARLGDHALAAVTTGAINLFSLTILPMGTVDSMRMSTPRRCSPRCLRATVTPCT